MKLLSHTIYRGYRGFVIFIMFLLVCLPSCSNDATITMTPPRSSKTAPALIQNPRTTATFPIDVMQLSSTVVLTPLSMTLTPIPILSDSLGSNVILLEGTGTGMYYLLDLDRGSGRYLKTDEALIVRIINWAEEGCSFIVLLANGDIVEINLRGTVLHSYFSNNMLPANSQQDVIISPDISPSKDWVAYRIASGEHIVDPQTMQEWYSYQEVYTMQLNSPKRVQQLSTRGGGYAVAWSPDGENIAFLDYDQSTLHLFTSRPDGSQKQIVATLPYDYQQIIRLDWPQKDQITLTYYQDQERPETISTHIFGKRSYDLPMQEILWWRDATTLVVLSRVNTQETVYLYDAESKSIVLEIPLSRFKKKNHIGLYRSPSVAGFFSEEGFTTYNTSSLSFDIYPNGDYSSIPGIGFIRNWYAPPDNFHGERFCKE